MMGKDLKKKILQKFSKDFIAIDQINLENTQGLGLNIVKNLVDLHDGEIVASNRLDREGAIVEIRFPSV
jgi:two-component system sensor histidine kinase ChvG